MIRIRPAAERGGFDFGWLDTRHTFSFGDYYDPRHMGFGSLRVINEDRIQPGGGFPMHPHRDMEILSYLAAGALEHRDSMGNGSVIRPGEVQRMTAGTGVRHSEFNPSKDEITHLIQIWIVPESRGLEPGYEQKPFVSRLGESGLALIASRDGRDGSVAINQDASVYAGRLPAARSAEYSLAPGRRAWVQLIAGSVNLNGHTLTAGDGAAIEQESALKIEAPGGAELLLFDLA